MKKVYDRPYIPPHEWHALKRQQSKVKQAYKHDEENWGRYYDDRRGKKVNPKGRRFNDPNTQ